MENRTSNMDAITETQTCSYAHADRGRTAAVGDNPTLELELSFFLKLIK